MTAGGGGTSVEPDPRPALALQDAGWQVAGTRCTACGHPSVERGPRCAVCGCTVDPAWFGPSGTVWSWTTVRIASTGREPPYTLAYIDLVDGPRILAHVDGALDLAAVDAPVRIIGHTSLGDTLVEVGP